MANYLFKGLCHVGVMTDNAEESVKWYCEKLGFRPWYAGKMGPMTLTFVEGYGLVIEFISAGKMAPGGPIAEYSMSRSYIWQIEDSTTTRAEQIVSPDSEKKDWFDLSGRRVELPQKGIYIHGNKKVIIK